MKRLLTAMRMKWRRRDILLLLERLELYVQAGLALDQALRSAEAGLPAHKKAGVASVRASVESGSLLSKGLIRCVGISSGTAALIEQGELSGGLPQALGTARSLLEKSEEIRSKCLGAMIYPAVIALFASVLTIGLVRGVMPQIIPMLKGMQVELPILTRMVIFLSDATVRYGLHVCGVMLAAGGSGILLYKKLPSARALVHYFVMKIPIAGSLFNAYALAAFLRSCGSLAESGISIPEAYGRTMQTVSWNPLRTALQAKMSDVEHGIPLAGAFSGRHAPSYVPALISAGEASGTLGTSLVRASSILERDIERSLKNLTSLIEPLMMVGMGCSVGAIALSIMLPIYDISKALQHS